jgi:hypothetical protein
MTFYNKIDKILSCKKVPTLLTSNELHEDFNNFTIAHNYLMKMFNNDTNDIDTKILIFADIILLKSYYELYTKKLYDISLSIEDITSKMEEYIEDITKVIKTYPMPIQKYNNKKISTLYKLITSKEIKGNNIPSYHKIIIEYTNLLL